MLQTMLAMTLGELLFFLRHLDNYAMIRWYERIVHQALTPLGYQVQVADDASAAIMLAAKNPPDLVIVDLNLIGLSGKDLLVAFNSQGLQVPVIVIAEKGQENQVIQAFRLGGTDYLLCPARETEVPGLSQEQAL